MVAVKAQEEYPKLRTYGTQNYMRTLMTNNRELAIRALP
jgi:hypothetical protein